MVPNTCSSGPTLSTAQSVAFAAPPSPLPNSRCPAGAPPGQVGGASVEVLAQKRLEQTSTSLEAALKVVETKLAQEGSVGR